MQNIDAGWCTEAYKNNRPTGHTVIVSNNDSTDNCDRMTLNFLLLRTRKCYSSLQFLHDMVYRENRLCESNKEFTQKILSQCSRYTFSFSKLQGVDDQAAKMKRFYLHQIKRDRCNQAGNPIVVIFKEDAAVYEKPRCTEKLTDNAKIQSSQSATQPSSPVSNTSPQSMTQVQRFSSIDKHGNNTVVQFEFEIYILKIKLCSKNPNESIPRATCRYVGHTTNPNRYNLSLQDYCKENAKRHSSIRLVDFDKYNVVDVQVTTHRFCGTTASCPGEKEQIIFDRECEDNNVDMDNNLFVRGSCYVTQPFCKVEPRRSSEELRRARDDVVYSGDFAGMPFVPRKKLCT
jgi:hypothetical protein